MSNGNGKHEALGRRSWWRRKVAGIPVIGWIIGTSGVALAAFLVALSLTGSISTAGFDVFATSTGTAVVSGNCTITANGGNSYDIQWSDGLGGETCDVTVGAESPGGNGVDAALQGATVTTGLDDDEVTITFGGACGTLLAPSSGTTAIPATITIESATASPGETYTIGGSVDWVPASAYQAGSCT